MTIRIHILAFLIAVFPAAAFSQDLPEVKTYEQLVQAIRAAEQANQPPTREGNVRTGWTVGKLIDNHIEANKLWGGYSADLYKKLVKDFDVNASRFQERRFFARTFPDAAPDQGLSWRHYVEAMYIKDAKLRDDLLRTAERENWSARRIEKEVKKVPKALEEKPKPERISTALYGPYKGQKVLDLGFGNFYRPALLDNHDPVETYPATVISVIDGDTLDVLVDLGFGFTTLQKIRLAGLDAPEMDSKKGYETKKFVVDELSKTEGQILLKGAAPDKYNRWLSEVLLKSPAEKDPVSLNQKILTAGYARPSNGSKN